MHIGAVGTPLGTTKLKPLGPVQAGKVRALYYMHTQGYVLLGRALAEVEAKNSKTVTQTFIWQRIDLNGSVAKIAQDTGITMLSCDPAGQSSSSTMWPVEAVPSRDGKLIAMVTAKPTCTDMGIGVTFLDAKTLKAVAPALKLNTKTLVDATSGKFSPTPYSDMSVRWTTSGELMISGFFVAVDTLNGWRIKPGEQPKYVDNISAHYDWAQTSSGSAHPTHGWLSVDGNGVLFASK